MSQRTGWARDLRVRVAGKGVVSHVGSALLRLLGDRAGLTTALSAALKVRGFTPDIDRGRVLADLAVAVADGATGIDDIRVLRDQGDLFGQVASTSTAWRCLDEIGELQLARIDRARAQVWRQIVARHGQIPSARTCYGDLGATIVIWLDASIVLAHSDKAGARGTWKGSYGHHPLLATCDNTGGAPRGAAISDGGERPSSLRRRSGGVKCRPPARWDHLEVSSASSMGVDRRAA